MASFSPASIFTPSPSFHKHPNKFVVPNSTILASPFPCKLFSHATSIRSSKLTSSAKTSPTNDVAVSTQTLTVEQWKLERDTLSKQIESLEQKVQQLTSESSSTKPSVDGILRDFYTLGQKFFEAKPTEETILTPAFTKALTNFSLKLQQLTSPDDGLLHIDPNPKPGPNSESIDKLVQEVFKLYGKPAELTYLKGNFAPVDETPPTSDIVVEEGKIPETLNGMMLRNGPNPKFNPEGSYMGFDGDGMIHGIRFKNGESPTYVARYTKTSRYLQQDEFNRSEVLLYGDQYGEYGLFAIFVDALRTRLMILDKSFGEMTTANVSLVYHAGRIMALEDFGQPHVIYVDEEGDLWTLGINNYNNELDHWLSPHPKKDAATGEMFNFGSMRTPPYCIYRNFTKDGDISDPIPIDVPYATYMHDLCITENYVIFQLHPVLYDPEKMKTSDDEFIFSFDPTKVPRYGIRSRNEDKPIQWFDMEGNFFVFHNVNAWEEDKDTIVLYCCNLEAKPHPKTGVPYIAPINFRRYDDIQDFLPSTTPNLYKMTFNLLTNTASKKQISDIMGDYPKINERYWGRKNDYAYSGQINLDNKQISIVKYDLKQEDGNPTRYIFGPNIYGSEVVFVPRDETSTDEDDGYLVTFVHKEVPDSVNKDIDVGTSYVYVIDAKTMELVARLRLPARVPYGIHSTYVTEDELKSQIKPIVRVAPSPIG